MNILNNICNNIRCKSVQTELIEDKSKFPGSAQPDVGVRLTSATGRKMDVWFWQKDMSILSGLEKPEKLVFSAMVVDGQMIRRDWETVYGRFDDGDALKNCKFAYASPEQRSILKKAAKVAIAYYKNAEREKQKQLSQWEKNKKQEKNKQINQVIEKFFSDREI